MSEYELRETHLDPPYLKRGRTLDFALSQRAIYSGYTPFRAGDEEQGWGNCGLFGDQALLNDCI